MGEFLEKHPDHCRKRNFASGRREGRGPFLGVSIHHHAPIKDFYSPARQVAMPLTPDGLRLCSLERKEDWCDWIGDGWQCSCEELKKRGVQCDIYPGHRHF